MTRAKRPILALIIACLAFAGAGVIVWQIPPVNAGVEIGVVALVAIGIGLGTSWIMGRKKTAFYVTILLLVSLLMNRFGILNWITFGLSLAVIGLISLIN